MDWLSEAARSRRFPALPDTLRDQLSKIAPSDGGLYRPCQVKLRSGRVVDRVYFAEAERWFRTWGVWPEEDSGKQWLDVGEVACAEESPSRLPPKFANQLYDAGESGMGYIVFVVCFCDGAQAPFVTGNAVDFIDYPTGQSAATVASVIPHAGRDEPSLQNAPDYFWCLYSDA
jgi:hypothetical protein